jgi:hypothetical protein
MKWALIVALLVMTTVGIVACGDDTETSTDTGDSSLSTFPDDITVDPIFASDEFKNPEVCDGCHSDIYKQWQGSMHNNSFTDPLYLAVHKQAGEETDGATDTFCSACHSPIGVFSGEVPPTEGDQISDISKQGIQCDFCHTVSGSTGIGNFSFIFEPSDIKRGPFDDAVSTYHETEYSELHTKSEFCGMCHDVNHPGNDVPLEATYTEWKESEYATNGVQCQDCHMTPGPGVTEPNPGRATIDSKDRPHIFTHFFVGGNAVLSDEAHQQLATEQLQAAAELRLIPPAAVTPGAMAALGIDVTNKGAGHYLPTGLTEVREMWLDVEIIDANGNSIYHSGALDDNGVIDEDAVIYHTVLEDKNGDATHKPWQAAGILSDHRIPPMGTVGESYGFDVPADVALPLTVNVTLKYRSAPQTVVDELLGDDAPTLPIIDMTSATATIN